MFLIRHHQVVPDTGADEHFTHALHLTQGFQQAGMRGVGEAQQRAYLRVDAAFILASAAMRFDVALKTVHIRGWS